MNEQRRFEESLRAILVDDRSRIRDDPPSEDKLLAYHRGELPGAEAEEVRNFLVHDPQAVRRLLDLTAQTGDPGDPDHLSDEDLEADWRSIQSRLAREAAEEDDVEPSAANVVSFPSGPAPERKPVRRPPAQGPPRRRAVFERIAAIVVFAFLGAWILTLIGRIDELEGPRVNERGYEILPDGSRGTGEPPARLTLGESGARLRFALFDRREFARYRLEIFAAGDAEPLWTNDDVEALPGRVFALYLPADFLPPGDYRVDLHGLGERWELLARYGLRIERANLKDRR